MTMTKFIVTRFQNQNSVEKLILDYRRSETGKNITVKQRKSIVDYRMRLKLKRKN